LRLQPEEAPGSSAARFVERFQAYWSDPDPEELRHILTDDVRLVQPLAPPTHGIDAAIASFRRLFAQFPDLRAAVDRWRGDDTCVFIEFRLRATLGRDVVEWPAVDRFTLRGDKASERVSYFDGLPLALRLLRHPRAAWRALRR
jgi:limonene-1,2-epoxide hydrolase